MLPGVVGGPFVVGSLRIVVYVFVFIMTSFFLLAVVGRFGSFFCMGRLRHTVVGNTFQLSEVCLVSTLKSIRNV